MRLRLAQGNLTEARAWAEQVDARPLEKIPRQMREEMTPLLLVSFADQQYEQALAVLEAFRAHLDRPENIKNMISFLSFYAVVLHQTGRQVQAREAVLRLLSQTEPEGYLRVYLDRGKPMQQLLQSLLDTPQEQGDEASPVPGSYISTLLAAFAGEEQKRAERMEASPPPEQEAQRSWQ